MDKYKLTANQQKIIDRMVEGEKLFRIFPYLMSKPSYYRLNGHPVNKMTIEALRQKGFIKFSEIIQNAGSTKHLYMLSKPNK